MTESRARQALIVVLVCWWAFAFRFATPDFTNDDFDHLSKARQVLFGELPERDFYDDGRPLTIYASALVQRISPTLLSELIFRAGAIAVGVGFVYLLARELSQSTGLGLVAALLTTAMQPRLYNYPKVLVFPAGLWLLWRYIDYPSRLRLVALAFATVVAFLFRYDYGVYLAIVYGITLVFVHRARALPMLTIYGAVGLACCAPYLVWLAAQGRLFSTGSGGVASLVRSMPGIARLPVHLDLSRGLFYFGPPEAIVGVRWSAATDAETERALERRYGLRAMGLRADGRTVRYFLDDSSPDRLLGLIADPHVEDTSGVNRGNGEVLASPTWAWWQYGIPKLRLTVFPTPEDAQGWIYYVFMLSAPLALLVLWLAPVQAVPQGAIKAASLAILCLILHQFLVQGVLESRLPDVAGPTAVLLAWLVARAVAVWRGRSSMWARVGRAATVAAIAILAVVTWLSVSLYANASFVNLLAAGVVRPSQLAEVTTRLGRRPLDYWTTAGSIGVPGLIRYVAGCLRPEDRLLLVSYEPEVYYLSERLFAGGINHFQPTGFNPTSAEILKRLRPQAVPVVIIDDKYRESFKRNWTDLDEYVHSRYREVADLGFGDPGRSFHILVDTQRPPFGSDPRWGLPCFTHE